MVFQIPEPGANKPENRFEFKDRRGKLHSLPKIEFLPAVAAKYLEGVTAGTVEDPGYTEFLRVFMTKAEPKVASVVDGLSRDQLVELRNAWYESSRDEKGEKKTDVGESVASSDS
jgi:hypothetical protein